MIVCRAASVWPPPETVTQVVCMRCQQNAPALQVLAAIWVTKFCDEGEQHDWSAQMLCEECAAYAVPPMGRV